MENQKAHAKWQHHVHVREGSVKTHNLLHIQTRINTKTYIDTHTYIRMYACVYACMFTHSFYSLTHTHAHAHAGMSPRATGLDVPQ